MVGLAFGPVVSPEALALALALEARGVTLQIAGAGRVKWQGPTYAVTLQDERTIRRFQADLVAILRYTNTLPSKVRRG